MGRHAFGALAALSLLVAVGTASAAPENFTSFSDPINKLSASLSPGTTGTMVGGRQGSSDPSSASYQKYSKGIIHYHPNFGAAWISPASVSALWEANKEMLGSPEKSSLTFPASAETLSCAGKKGLTGTITYFTGGGIVYTEAKGSVPASTVMLTGPTWVKYLLIGDVFGTVGPPQPSRSYIKGGPATKGTNFACGWIVEAPQGTSQYKPAFFMLEDSPIARRHQGIGTTPQALNVGDPMGDQFSIVKGVPIGSQQRFSRGTIVYSAATGAQVLVSNKGAEGTRTRLLEEYENTGGPKGLLGFPTSEIQTLWRKNPKGTTSALYAINCQKGVIVFYPTVAGAPLPWGTTQIFTSLSVYIETLKTYGTDGVWPFESNQDPYFFVTLSAPGVSKKTRIPTIKQYDNAPVVTIKSATGLVVPKMTATAVISLKFEAWDQDDVTGDDFLGRVSNSLDIATGWGVWAGIFSTRSSDFRPEYSIKRSADVASLALKPQWRYNYQWPFRNFETRELTEDQMTDTFTDIGRDESVLAHPIHALFYEFVYKKLADNGNCFGMALSAAYAEVGRLAYVPPLGALGSPSARNGGCICTKCDQPCGPGNVAAADKNYVLKINEYHGYQLGAYIGCKGLELYKQMLQTNFQVLNGHRVFADASAGHTRGDPQLISMAGDMVGHVIRAYKFRSSVTDAKCSNLGVAKCHIMYIADPNHPYTTAEQNDHDRWKLVVHPFNGRWYYDSKYNNLMPKRYALMNIPFSWVSYRGPSIVDDIPWGTLFDIGWLMLFGSADLDQVTDQAGKPLGTADAQVTRLPSPSDLSTVLPGGLGLLGSSVPTLYAVRRFRGASTQAIQIRIRPRGNYTLAFKTPDGSFQWEASRGDGSLDVVTVAGYDTTPAAQAFTATPGSPKGVILCLTAPTRTAASGPPLVYMLSKLDVAKGERISASLLDGGAALRATSSLNGASKQLQYDLQVSRGVDVAGLSNALRYGRISGIGTQLLVPKILPIRVINIGKKKKKQKK